MDHAAGAAAPIDGRSGAIYLGRDNVVVDRLEAELAQIKRWRDQSVSSAPERLDLG